MKKTISINISGVVFNIEEDAYEDLKRYLDTISSYFTDSDGREEIMADIEARIAELFHGRLSDGKNVVNGQDVSEVIDIMGRPEDYLGDEEQQYAHAAGGAGRAKTKRRLYRDKDKNVLGGVSAGISHYFGWDPMWLRLFWVLSVLIFGIGVLPYIILWIIVPAAETTSEKLEMMGEPVTVENIKKKVDEAVSSFRSGDGGLDTRFQSEYAGRQVRRGGDALVDALKAVVRFCGKFLGFLLFVTGVALAAFLIYTSLDSSWIRGSMDGVGFGFSDLREVIFTSDINYFTMWIGAALVTIIPIIGMVLLGSRLLFGLRSQSRLVTPSMVGLWVMGMVMLIIASISLGKEFSTHRYLSDRSRIPAESELIYVEMNEDYSYSDSNESYRGLRHDSHLELRGDSIYCGFPQLDIEIGRNESVELEIRRESNGFTRESAVQRAEHVEYSYEFSKDTLRFDPFFRFLRSDKFRGQEVELILRVPEGMSIYLDDELYSMLDDVHTREYVRHSELVGRKWLMTPEGLIDELAPTKEPVESPERDEPLGDPDDLDSLR